MLPDEEKLRVILSMDLVLGLDLLTLDRHALRVHPAAAALTDDAVEQRVGRRQEAKSARDFAAADAIRSELKAAGVEVMDGDPLGWEWAIRLD